MKAINGFALVILKSKFPPKYILHFELNLHKNKKQKTHKNLQQFEWHMGIVMCRCILASLYVFACVCLFDATLFSLSITLAVVFFFLSLVLSLINLNCVIKVWKCYLIFAYTYVCFSVVVGGVGGVSVFFILHPNDNGFLMSMLLRLGL